MNAAKKIAKAIEKLEGLKAESTRGPWRSVVTAGDHWHIDSPDAEEMVGHISANDGLNEARRRPNADLIVTLHRTIDAQLAILGHALARAESKVRLGGIPRVVWSNERDAQALAEAILGGDQ